MAKYQDILNEVLKSDAFSEALMTGDPTEIMVVARLKALRILRGMTQKDLSDKMGCKQPNISRFESPEYEGRNLGTILTYASAVGARLEVNIFTEEKGG